MILGWFSKGRSLDRELQLPIVKFDRSRVTEEVKADLWAGIQAYEDLPLGEERAIYEAALEAISLGGALNIATQKLTSLGVSRERAAEIARYLNQRARHIMDTDKMLDMGITRAHWMWSGACDLGGHQAANEQIYSLRRGLMINGRATFPALEPGCTCAANAVVPGFD